MRGLVFILGVALVHVSLNALEMRLPIALESRTNELKKTDLGMSLGIASHLWLWKINRFSFGPMIGLFGSMPLYAGNHAVRVSRYRILGQAGFSTAISWGDESFTIRPFLDLYALAGGMIIDKRVALHQSRSANFIFGGGTHLGVSYWFNAVALLSGYGFSIEPDGAAHRLELGFGFHL